MIKSVLILAFVLFCNTLFSQIGVEKRDDLENDKIAWYLYNSTKKKAKVKIEKTFYLCNNEVDTKVFTKISPPGKDIFLDHYKNICFSDFKSYREYTVLSIEIMN